jgi:hypothetical protein
MSKEIRPSTPQPTNLERPPVLAPEPQPGNTLPQVQPTSALITPEIAESERYPNTESIKADADFVTDRLSSQVRSLAFGTLGVIWASLIAKDSALHLDKGLSIWVALLAVSTLFLDFLQYVVAYQLIRKFDRSLKGDEDISQ